jgi:multiple sugar transport system permease protein
VLSLGIAMLLNTAIAGKGFYRTIYFLPVITSIAAISVVWKWIYNSEYGLLNHWLGLERFDWLQQNEGIFLLAAKKLSPAVTTLPMLVPEGPSIAMLAVIVMSVWKGLGYNAVIFLAGLQNIPRELYEVAKIDGASAWSAFKNITWPLLSPTTYFILVVTTISSFQVFAQIWMLYDGMPSESTRVIVMLLYDTAFKSNDFGYASALAYALFGIIFSLTMVQRKLAESRVHYQ